MLTYKKEGLKKCSYETALDFTGFGKYNTGMLVTCCLLILAMYLDIFGLSVAMPAVACDLSLNTAQQGLLSAVPLIGVILSSYGWGLAADTLGRRKTLLTAMPIGFVLSIAGSMAPTYTSLTIIKLFSVMFSSAANAAAFVLMAESVPNKHRNRFMFIMAGSTMCVLCFTCCCALPIFKLSFRVAMPWLDMDYRPWRLLLQVISLPAPIGVIYLFFLNESPKFLLSKKNEIDAIAVLQSIFKSNTGHPKADYPVTGVYLDDTVVVNSSETAILRKVWNQTAPLFKPPLLKNSTILYYLLLCAYMTSTGYTMWVPTMTNAFFTGENSSGRTFCQVASRSAHTNITLSEDCDNVIKPVTLYAVMCYSGGATCLTILLSFIVGPLGKKKVTLIVFALSACCGTLLLFIRIPLLSIAFFFMFLYVAQILGNINAYLVDLNPTHLRGMASCLSVVVARGFGFFSVQLIGSLLANHCTPTLIGYLLLVVSGFIVATFLPPDSKLKNCDSADAKNYSEMVELGDKCEIK